MRVHDDKSNELDYVYIALTDEEAEQLIAYLEQLLDAKGTKGEHWHVSFPPTYAPEVTIYRADDDTAMF